MNPFYVRYRQGRYAKDEKLGVDFFAVDCHRARACIRELLPILRT